MIRVLVIALAIAGAVLAGGEYAQAAEWNTIRPGESTQSAVRAQFGAPTKTATQKVEGYDTAQWIYEGPQAPKGITRATIDFGILTPQGYRADFVRQMMLEPRRGTFRLPTIVQGWGEPDASGVENGVKVLRYKSGLFVYFDREGLVAERMYFTPPQPAAAEAPPRR